MELKGKTAVITGGASGLGEATVRRYHAQGVNIAIFDMNEDRGHVIVKELGDNVLFFKLDVSDETAVSEAIERTMEKFGSIHICNNFAGVGYAHKIFDGKKDAPHPLRAFQKILNVNLVGTFNLCRLAAQQMAKSEPVTECGQRGVITNTASIAGYEGQIGQVAYTASKGGIIGMTLVIARDLASLGIRCNTIAPGLIHTPLFDTAPENVMKALEATVLNPQRLGKPDEIAKLAQHIVENDYLNGEVIRLDGGLRMAPR